MMTYSVLTRGFCALLLGCSAMSVRAWAQDAHAGATPSHSQAPKAAPAKHAASKPAAAVVKKAEASKAAPPAQAEPPRDVTNVFGSWTVNCAKKQASTDPANCVALIPVMRNKDDKRTIVIMGVKRAGDVFTFFTHTPTTVDIKAGVEVQFEGRAARRFDFGSCEPALCTVSMPLDNPLLDELLNVPQVSVTWTNLSVGQAKIVFPIAGAREALEFLRVQ